jgi:hypothetical protein
MVHIVAPTSGTTHAQQVVKLSKRYQAADLWYMMMIEVEDTREDEE